MLVLIPQAGVRPSSQKTRTGEGRKQAWAGNSWDDWAQDLSQVPREADGWPGLCTSPQSAIYQLLGTGCPQGEAMTLVKGTQ